MSTRKKIFLVTLICSIMCGICAVYQIVRSSRPSAGRPYERLKAEEAKRYMSYEKNFTVVDVRPPDLYEKGHLDKAVNIPPDQIVKEGYSLLTDMDMSIYVYGETSEQSCAAAQKLSDMGYTSVAEIGIYSDWTAEKDETESEKLMDFVIMS